MISWKIRTNIKGSAMRGLTNDERDTLNRWIRGDYIIFKTDERPTVHIDLAMSGRAYRGESTLKGTSVMWHPTEMGLLALRVDAIVRSIQGVTLV